MDANQHRRLFAWSLAAGLVLIAVLAAPAALGLVYTHDDLGAFHLPVRAFYADQLARGEAFDWMPGLYCGFYLTGEGQAGTYHPLHLLLYRSLPLATAWSVELVLSYPFMLAGTYFFLRRRLGRRDAAMFGGLVFTFGSFNLLHFVHPNAVAVVAHVPWLLLAIEALLKNNQSAAAWAGIAVLTGSQVLLGYPQYVWFSFVAEMACAAFLIGAKKSAEPSPGIARACWALATAKLAGVLLGGVQLLPTVDALSHSVRRVTDAALVNSGSLHPLNLVQLVAPYLFTRRVAGENTHELGLYLGAVPLMLIVWLAADRHRLGRLRPMAVSASAFGLAALLLACGKYGPLYRFQRFLPIVGDFRFPCRYIVLFQLAAAALAGMGLLLLLRRQVARGEAGWRKLAPLWVVVAIGFLAAVVGWSFGSSSRIAAPAAVLAGPFLMLTAAGFITLAARGVRWAPVALILFAAADLGLYGLSYATVPHVESLSGFARRTVVPPGFPGARVVASPARFGLPELRTGNEILLAGWRRADGYAGLEPARRLDYGRLAALRTAGVHWVKRNESTTDVQGLLPHDSEWLKVPSPLPPAWLVSRTLSTDDPARDIARVSVGSTALVEYPLVLPRGSPGIATTIQRRPGRYRIHVDCPSTQLLVVSESYHPGWRAEVDGRPQPVWRANGDFLACAVQPGRHDVVFRFQPQSLRSGKIVSCLGLMLLAVGTTARLAPRPISKDAKEEP